MTKYYNQEFRQEATEPVFDKLVKYRTKGRQTISLPTSAEHLIRSIWTKDSGLCNVLLPTVTLQATYLTFTNKKSTAYEKLSVRHTMELFFRSIKTENISKSTVVLLEYLKDQKLYL